MDHWFTKNIKKMSFNTAIVGFEIGDIVRVPGNIKGKVVNWQIDPDGTVQYEVEFVDKTLIPPTMWYPEHYIDQHPSDKKCNNLKKYDCQCGIDSVYGKNNNIPAHGHDPFCPKFRRN
jgi:hypothetical protein